MSTHIKPAVDAFDHELSPDCPCGPQVIEFKGSNGNGYAYEHQALTPLPLAPPAEPE